MGALLANIPRWWKQSALMALELDQPEVQDHPFLTGQPNNWHAYGMSRPETLATMASELENFDQAIESLAQNSAALTNKRLLVLTTLRSFDWFSRGQQSPAFLEAAELWTVLQDELLSLSNKHAHQFSAEGTHALQYSDPESVARAIKSLTRLYQGDVRNISQLDQRG